MNTNAYIESGILEAYSLGALPPAERVAVEAQVAASPEVAAALREIEETLIQFAEQDAEVPPPGMQNRIWAALARDLSAQQTAGKTIPFPAAGSQVAGKTIPLAGRSGSLPWQRAALWAGLAISLAGNALLWTGRQAAHRDRDFYAQQLSKLQQERGAMQQQLVTFGQERAMMTDPLMTRVVMTSPAGEAGMRGALFIAPGGEEAYLALAKMPPPPPGKQYQLWVLKDGKPVDMGVIPNALVSGGTEKMRMPVKGGQAYAISLEKEGGSPVPTMEQIQVLGKV